MAASRLIIIGGPARGQVIDLAQTVTIGRDPAIECPIADLALSRQHCRIAFTPGPSVTDLDSRNGTQVNGMPVRHHQLADGDQIRVGDSVLLYVAGLPAETLPALADGAASTDALPLIVETVDLGRMTFTIEQAVQHDMVGQSPAMTEVHRRIAKAAPTDSTVLISGESGTGKELVARAIHAHSGRAHGPFVAVNCAAVPDGLMESELFGHERGAFTGALAQKRGRIETGHGGTIFLDEIGELPVALQAKLLRVLQERTLDRVGGTRPVPVDIRVVAASNMDLAAAVKTGAFRPDLFYRLNVVSIAVPPLRERAGDVPLLVAYFVRKHAARCKRRIRGVSREARVRLDRCAWPGNVRELENAIERAVVMSEGEWIEVGDLPEHVIDASSDEGAGAGYHEQITSAKRETIRRALEHCDGNVARAARELRLQPTYLHRLLSNLGLRDTAPGGE